MGMAEGADPQSEFLRNGNDLEYGTPVHSAAISHLNIHEFLHAIDIKLAMEPVGVGKPDEIAVARIDLFRERIGDFAHPFLGVWWDETVVRSQNALLLSFSHAGCKGRSFNGYALLRIGNLDDVRKLSGGL